MNLICLQGREIDSSYVLGYLMGKLQPRIPS